MDDSQYLFAGATDPWEASCGVRSSIHHGWPEGNGQWHSGPYNCTRPP